MFYINKQNAIHPLSALTLFVILLLSPQFVRAQTVVSLYPFTGNSLSSTDTDLNSTATDIAIGSGLTGFTSFTSIDGDPPPMFLMQSTGTDSTEALAVAGNDYFSFTLTPVAGITLDYTSIGFRKIALSFTSSYTASFFVRTSVDNFATTIGTVSSITSPGGTSTLGFASFSLTSLPDQTGPVTFRVYAFDNRTLTDSYAGVDEVSVSANVVPEPRTSLLAVLGGAAFLGLRRDRQRGLAEAA